MSSDTTIRLLIRGIVQGVGFRPYLHRLAEKYRIAGWARNTSSGLECLLQGQSEAVNHFLCEMKSAPPPLAVIDAVEVSPVSEAGRYTAFTIEESRTDGGATLVSADIAICDDCIRELYTPSDRRYRYPFINCTNCGPRYTIIKSLPYDRQNTVMQAFPMCSGCAEEYYDIHNRRYHAQPDCCPKCGPQVFYTDSTGAKKEGDPFKAAQSLLAGGGILAVKGIGGIHLACDAANASAAARLRQKKHRPEKPLAVMCRSLDAVRNICTLAEDEEKLLTSTARPIVLLAKREKSQLPWLSFGARLGVMLPYTPLHMLLLDGSFGGPDTIVMTSANKSGCPVMTENDEALEGLVGIADGFLLHNRPIQNRCDDSVIAPWHGAPYYFRKSRGYAPTPLETDFNADGILAMGAEQKASFAMGRGHHVFLSPHIGDLKNAETLIHYQKTLKTYEQLFHITPSLYVCDLHPDYLSVQEAQNAASQNGCPVIGVQHHWAHMASCMADNGLSGKCFGIIWDGTGLGTDGTIWGGEFLIGDYESFIRAGSIRPAALAGGDQAIKEIGRIALALLEDAGIDDHSCVPLDGQKCRWLRQLIKSGQTPAASSIGRLFDGICALIMQKPSVSYEGEGAALLEALSPYEVPNFGGMSQMDTYPTAFYQHSGIRFFDTRPMILNIWKDFHNNTDTSVIALRFMSTLCQMALAQCSALNREHLPIVLSGGVFQNRFLLSGVTDLLTQNGFTVYTHRRVSPNDEGLCLGQLAIAQKKRRPDNVFSNANEN